VALAIHDDRLTRRVGAIVLLVASIVVGYVVFVRDRLQREGVVMRIHFGVVVGLPQGSPVRLAGRQIGEVRSIGIAHGGGVTTEIVIDRDWAARIPINADFFVDARSALAPRYVAIGPPPGGAPPGRPIRDGDAVVGIDPPNLDRLLQRIWDNLEDVRRFLEAIRPAVATIKASAGRLAVTVRAVDTHPGAQAEMRAAVAAAASHAVQMIEDLQEGHVDPAAFRRLAGELDVLGQRIDATVDGLRAQVADMQAALGRAEVAASLGPSLAARLDRTLATADRALLQTKELTAQIRGVIHDATKGNGTIAAFAADLELIDDVKELTKELKRNPWRTMPPPSP
jgi:ABC-type transporter Mla subunit MlaD